MTQLALTYMPTFCNISNALGAIRQKTDRNWGRQTQQKTDVHNQKKHKTKISNIYSTQNFFLILLRHNHKNYMIIAAIIMQNMLC